MSYPRSGMLYCRKKYKELQIAFKETPFRILPKREPFENENKR